MNYKKSDDGLVPMPMFSGNQQDVILRSLNQVSDLLSNPVIIKELSRQGKMVDIKALVKTYFEVSGYPMPSHLIFDQRPLSDS